MLKPPALPGDTYFVFFALGVWFGTVKDRMERRPLPWAVAGLLAGAVAQYLFQVEGSLTHEDKGLASLLVASLSILAVAGVAMGLARAPVSWMLAVGHASMAIYVMHILTGSGVRILLLRGFDLQEVSLHLLAGCLASVLPPMLVLHLAARLGIRGLFGAPPRFSAERGYRRWAARTTA